VLIENLTRLGVLGIEDNEGFWLRMLFILLCDDSRELLSGIGVALFFRECNGDDGLEIEIEVDF